MKLDWDAANTMHLWERHQLLPETIEEAMLTLRRKYKLQIVNNESRVVYIAGSVECGVFTVVTTKRGSKTRVISGRPASRKEREFFKEGK